MRRESTTRSRPRTTPQPFRGWGAVAPGFLLLVPVLLVLALSSHAAVASVETEAASVQEEDARQRVRVAQERANVHQGEATYRVVLVQVPEGTVFDVVGRAGEWYEIELPEELREADDVTVIRWYEDEETGWVHQSWVEVVE